jgi:type I restriction enzyme, R subunit
MQNINKERVTLSQLEQYLSKAALTELFLEMKNDQTPVIVERIVMEIDEIVKIVRIDGWQTSVTGEREVQKSLRKTLLKYKLHKEEDLFHRAYEHIKEYY